MWHLLASTPTEGVFLPVLCTGQPCVSSLDSQGTSHSLVHLTMRAACVVKDWHITCIFWRSGPLPFHLASQLWPKHSTKGSLKNLQYTAYCIFTVANVFEDGPLFLGLGSMILGQAVPRGWGRQGPLSVILSAVPTFSTICHSALCGTCYFRSWAPARFCLSDPLLISPNILVVFLFWACLLHACQPLFYYLSPVFFHFLENPRSLMTLLPSSSLWYFIISVLLKRDEWYIWGGRLEMSSSWHPLPGQRAHWRWSKTNGLSWGLLHWKAQPEGDFSPGRDWKANVGSQHRISTRSTSVCSEESPGSWATTF